ncbi:MAG TPA: M61 family peptidase [Candidatus Binatia bacterium]|nr:M61 family peptidase [Candidatus Binatia bacterium]
MRAILVWLFVLFAAVRAIAADAPIVLKLDARDASRKVLHATLHIPAQPGPLTLLYPKWIPGEHGPTGPIADLTGLKITAGAQPVPWRRDPLENYAFEVTVPDSANAIDVALDFLLPSDPEGFSFAASSSASLAVISWNTVLLYPKGPGASAINFAAHIQLPNGWKYATALTRATESADGVEFAPATLETLIDSPLAAGAYFRTFDLSPGASAPHRLNVIADSAAALEMKPDDVARFSKLVNEEESLFGARHFRKYDFLLTLSEQVAHFGLEHHESSDNRAPERMLIDEEFRKSWAGLLPHEMVHSWNGKYRRPADITTANYHQPMKTELLWVYEGLTTYLGEVLTARSGLWNVTNYLEHLALIGAQLDYQRGRSWRPLADTTVAAHLLYYARSEGAAWRRSVDFYPEGELIWLEADVTIRERTQGKRSLDDFCQRFYGGENTPPRVVPYTLDDVVAALNEIAPFDWRGFFQQRVYSVNPRAPLGGIEHGGWRLVFRDTPSDLLKTAETTKKFTDLSFSIGLSLKEDGAIQDVIPGSPADRAGVGPGMKLLAVNTRRWKPELIRTAVKEAKDGAPIELLVENGDAFKTCRLDYRDGERYPHLERDTAKPDLLTQIIQARTK